MSAARYGASLIAGKAVYGITEIGTRGDAIPSGGTSGPGFIYADLSLPADAAKKYRGQIIAWPSAGTLFAYEDTSFTFSDAPDGTYTFTYRLWENGVDKGTAVVTLQVGVVSAPGATLTAAASILAGVASAAGSASGQILTAAASLIAGSIVLSNPAAGVTLTAAASLAAGSASGGGSSTAAGVTLSAVASLLAGSAAGQANAPGAIFAAAASLIAGSASGMTDGTAAGATLMAAASIIAGSATGPINATAPGATMIGAVSLLTGAAFGPILAATKGYTARLHLKRYSGQR